jgi:hypothetical protein
MQRKIRVFLVLATQTAPALHLTWEIKEIQDQVADSLEKVLVLLNLYQPQVQIYFRICSRESLKTNLNRPCFGTSVSMDYKPVCRVTI